MFVLLPSPNILTFPVSLSFHVTDYVDTLCMPPAGARVEELLGGSEAEVAGWGNTEGGQQADILQKASLPFVSKATCNPIFNNELVPEQVRFCIYHR